MYIYYALVSLRCTPYPIVLKKHPRVAWGTQMHFTTKIIFPLPFHPGFPMRSTPNRYLLLWYTTRLLPPPQISELSPEQANMQYFVSISWPPFFIPLSHP